MTARVSQQIKPRHRSDFRSALQWMGKTSQVHARTFRPTQSISWGVPRPLRVREQGSINPNTITISLGFMALITVALLGFFYLQQVVSTASQGTDVHNIETQIAGLRDKQRQLELEGAQLRSLQTIENRVEKLNLVTTDKVSYLANTSDKVAVSTTNIAR